ncbi:cysteine hydrolase family protein [Streptomyces sp. CG1]|uniref:cysteine hydrolase family protein n=1 Tax=Streptomyces sp. CG1 TaxID=1287523 RepID=UPI0034E2FB8D
MDVQRSLVDRFDEDDYLPRLADAVGAAREAGLPVLHVVIGFRPGHPEVSPRNKVFGAVAGSGWFTEGDPGAEIHPGVAPRPGEAVVTKRCVSAFPGSDLDLVLRTGGIDHLVLTCIATSGVVLSTVCRAADLDHRLTVLADGCRDGDPEVHDVLTRKAFPRQADVLSVAEWTKSLDADRS